MHRLRSHDGLPSSQNEDTRAGVSSACRARRVASSTGSNQSRPKLEVDRRSSSQPLNQPPHRVPPLSRVRNGLVTPSEPMASGMPAAIVERTAPARAATVSPSLARLPAGSIKCDGFCTTTTPSLKPAEIGLAAADRHVRCAAARAARLRRPSARVRRERPRSRRRQTACTIGYSPAAHPTIQVGPISRLPATAQDPPRTRRLLGHARCCLRRRGDSGGRGRFPTQAEHMPRAHRARSLRLRRQARPTSQRRPRVMSLYRYRSLRNHRP